MKRAFIQEVEIHRGTPRARRIRRRRHQKRKSVLVLTHGIPREQLLIFFNTSALVPAFVLLSFLSITSGRSHTNAFLSKVVLAKSHSSSLLLPLLLRCRKWFCRRIRVRQSLIRAHPHHHHHLESYFVVKIPPSFQPFFEAFTSQKVVVEKRRFRRRRLQTKKKKRRRRRAQTSPVLFLFLVRSSSSNRREKKSLLRCPLPSSQKVIRVNNVLSKKKLLSRSLSLSLSLR